MGSAWVVRREGTVRRRCVKTPTSWSGRGVSGALAMVAGLLLVAVVVVSLAALVIPSAAGSPVDAWHAPYDRCIAFAPVQPDVQGATDATPEVLASHSNQSVLAAANQCFWQPDVQQYHCMPSLLIPGVQKATTSAARDLLNSPCLRMPRLEDHFWDAHWTWSAVMKAFRTQYVHQHVVPTTMIDVGRVPMYFDKTPRYLNMPDAAELSARLMPFARSLIILREPVDRTQSHFLMTCSNRPAEWWLRPSASNTAVLRLCRGGARQDLKRPKEKGFRVPDCPKNIAELSGALKVSCTRESFDLAVPALTQAHRSAKTSWRTYEYGPEGTWLQRSLYVPQVERWISAYSHGRALTVLHEDLASHVTVLWPLAMWYLGFDVPGATPVAQANASDHPDYGDRHHGHGTPMPVMLEDAYDMLRPGHVPHRRMLRTTHTGIAPDAETTHRLTDTVFCEENRRLAKLFAPMPFPGVWHCTELTDEVRAASHGHLHTRIPVSSEYLSAAARHDPASRVPVGEWHIYRIPFTAERELPWNRRSVNGEAWMWGARFITAPGSAPPPAGAAP